jgi:pimeloyl-ACP methyl ester carboxylesterase
MPASWSFELETPSGEVLRGTVDRSDRPGPRPTVVICHGFKGFQEWGFFPYLADLLAARGLTVVRFNLPGSGMRPGDALVTDHEAFRTARPSVDLEALTWLVRQLPDPDPGVIDAERVALLGHSRGGGMAVLASAATGCRDRVRALVTWSAVASFDRLSAEETAEWRRTGELTIVNARTGQELSLGTEVLDDLEAHAELLDIEAAATRRRAPWLIVHGQTDETVPLAEAHRLHGCARQPAEILEVPAAGHTFEVGHPFVRPSPQLIRVLNETQRWLRRHLVSD